MSPSMTFGSGYDLDTTGGGGIDLDITEDPTEDTEVVVFKSLPDRLTNCVRWGFLGFFNNPNEPLFYQTVQSCVSVWTGQENYFHKD